MTAPKILGRLAVLAEVHVKVRLIVFSALRALAEAPPTLLALHGQLIIQYIYYRWLGPIALA